jgi:hypothetical protein
MIREQDESGVSGTGHVLDGVIFPWTGKVVVNWRTENSSISIYDSWNTFVNIHIVPHPLNNTHIEWY